jgi:hypothetical protein
MMGTAAFNMALATRHPFDSLLDGFSIFVLYNRVYPCKGAGS